MNLRSVTQPILTPASQLANSLQSWLHLGFSSSFARLPSLLEMAPSGSAINHKRSQSGRRSSINSYATEVPGGFGSAFLKQLSTFSQLLRVTRADLNSGCFTFHCLLFTTNHSLGLCPTRDATQICRPSSMAQEAQLLYITTKKLAHQVATIGS